MFPAQPLADLMTYMQSLENKTNSCRDMITKLATSQEPVAQKFFACKRSTLLSMHEPYY